MIMGGGSSRFEETDWENASGKLTSMEETIDGFPPTSKYKVYHINKTAGVINQREYDVTDDESNLLYSTRGIEGRLAWFDVLGPGIDQYLLRVQVDLSRRYWVIYRFGQPSYPGQFADAAATGLLRQSRGDSQPCLYKKACITVTWSRYHAIVNLYGPPPDDFMDERSKAKVGAVEGEEKKDDIPSWAMVGPEFLAKDSAKQTTSASPEKLESPDKATPLDKEKDEVEQHLDTVNETTLEEPAANEPPIDEPQIDDVGDGTQDANTNDEIETSTDPDTPRPVVPLRDFSNPIPEVPEHLRNPNLGPKKRQSKSHKHIKKFSKWVKENTTELPPDPLEGYLQLDKPILKCEEINSFLGQHQTMLVSDKEAKRLEEEELQTAAALGADAHTPDANIKQGTAPTEAGVPAPAEGGAPAAKKKGNDKAFPGMRKIGRWLKKVGEAGSEWAANVEASFDGAAHEKLDPSTEKDPRRASLAVGEDKVDSDIDNSDQIKRTPSHASLDGLSTSSSKSGKLEDLEPLVGFWNWDNTMRVHKMKMHVAEGSDLALHVVLAIVTNQLRLERNVVVTTV